MHRCFRDGTFAIGLILGISLTLIFIIWSLSGLGWMWSDDPKPYSYTYTEKKCAEQKIGHGADMAIILKGQNANASKQGNSEQPNWCDLASQESMAKSTYRMNLAAWAGIVLSAVGVMLIWKTLVASRQTLREAENATKAAFKSVEVTREIGEAQVRAYLSVPDVVLDWSDDNTLSKVKFIIKNAGQSPAMKVSIDSLISVVEPAGFHHTIGTEEFRNGFRNVLKATPSGNIPSGGTRKTMVGPAQTPTSLQIERWKRLELDIFGYVYIKYNDVFGKEQFVEYCTRFIFEETETQIFTHFEIFGPLNSAS